MCGVFCMAILASFGHAAVLPEDRADIMYHGYDGGGLQVDGPSVLVRKGFKDKVSVWANYYVDMITSASIDVVSTASEYTEERKEKSIGFDYLHGKTSMGLSYTNSEESDYSANSVSFAISQDFFGDLTTFMSVGRPGKLPTPSADTMPVSSPPSAHRAISVWCTPQSVT